MRIRKIRDYHVTCERCAHGERIFSVYQEYYHFYFIPFFPAGEKTIQSVCVKCDDVFTQAKKQDYLQLTGSPIYLYSGPLIFIAILVIGFTDNIHTQSEKKEFVSHPKAGDVYLIKDVSETYHFEKVTRLHGDTMDLIRGIYDYNGFVSDMDTSDYFYKSGKFRILRNQAVKDMESDRIRAVMRNYPSESRFSIEK